MDAIDSLEALSKGLPPGKPTAANDDPSSKKPDFGAKTSAPPGGSGPAKPGGAPGNAGQGAGPMDKPEPPAKPGEGKPGAAAQAADPEKGSVQYPTKVKNPETGEFEFVYLDEAERDPNARFVVSDETGEGAHWECPQDSEHYDAFKQWKAARKKGLAGAQIPPELVQGAMAHAEKHHYDGGPHKAAYDDHLEHQNGSNPTAPPSHHTVKNGNGSHPAMQGKQDQGKDDGGKGAQPPQKPGAQAGPPGNSGQGDKPADDDQKKDLIGKLAEFANPHQPAQGDVSGGTPSGRSRSGTEHATSGEVQADEDGYQAIYGNLRRSGDPISDLAFFAKAGAHKYISRKRNAKGGYDYTYPDEGGGKGGAGEQTISKKVDASKLQEGDIIQAAAGPAEVQSASAMGGATAVSYRYLDSGDYHERSMSGEVTVHLEHPAIGKHNAKQKEAKAEQDHWEDVKAAKSKLARTMNLPEHKVSSQAMINETQIVASAGGDGQSMLDWVKDTFPNAELHHDQIFVSIPKKKAGAPAAEKKPAEKPSSPTTGDNKHTDHELAAMHTLTGYKAGKYRNDKWSSHGLGEFGPDNPHVKALVDKGLVKIRGKSVVPQKKQINAAMAASVAPKSIDLENASLSFGKARAERDANYDKNWRAASDQDAWNRASGMRGKMDPIAALGVVAGGKAVYGVDSDDLKVHSEMLDDASVHKSEAGMHFTGDGYDSLRKGIYSFDLSHGAKNTPVPDNLLYDYLCAFIEEAHEHEQREPQHRDVMAGDDYYTSFAVPVLHELVQYIPKNPNLARAAKKFKVTAEVVVEIMKKHGMIKPPTDAHQSNGDYWSHDWDSMTAMGVNERSGPTGEVLMVSDARHRLIPEPDAAQPLRLRKGPAMVRFGYDGRDVSGVVTRASLGQIRQHYADDPVVKANHDPNCLLHGRDVHKQQIGHSATLAKCSCPG